jgi:hypothetical protein
MFVWIESGGMIDMRDRGPDRWTDRPPVDRDGRRGTRPDSD